jgi:hypothetical protein
MRLQTANLASRVLTTVAIFCVSSWATRAQAAIASLNDALKPLGQNLLEIVEKDQKQTAIAVGDFTAPPGFDANAGPGIGEALKSVLEELRPGVVQKRANLFLRGRYDKSKDPKNPELLIVKVTAEVTDSNGNFIADRIAELRDTGLIAGVLGATVSLPPAATHEKRVKELEKYLDKPEYNQSAGDPPGTLIKAKSDSPFSIEILVTSEDQAPKEAKGWREVAPRAPRTEGGEPFVEIKRNEVYAIRVHNGFEYEGTKYEAAVAVSIDGIDAFTFSEIRDAKGKPKYTHYIVPFGQSTIPGWHKTNEHSDSFLVTKYGQGAASQQPERSRGKVGIITFRFALAWTGNSVPDAEKGARDASNETGFGPPVQTELKEVARQVGTVRDVISVRYTR